MPLFLSRFSRFFGSAYWFLVSVCIFIVLLWLSWQVLKLQNFHYSLWYDWLDIKQHIELYGPQNIYYLGLEHLAKTEHVALFSYIVDAIHQHGEGLSQITFYNGSVLQPLLTQAEITHLEDVANLINVINGVAFVSFFALVLLLALPRFITGCYPKFKALGLFNIYFCLLFLVGGSLFVVGPTAVFYWFHTIIFPIDHPWFFYYQDSLMTTLMKAPDLFGAIAATLMLYCSVFLVIGLLLMARLGRLFKTR